MISLKNPLKNIFFILVCLFLVVLSSIRGKPIYGKLDFMLVDGKPWWPSWKPMVEYALQSGNKPITSDIITSAVLYGVFGEKTVYLLKKPKPRVLSIEEMNALAEPRVRVLPVGALLLLLSDVKRNNRWLIEHLAEYISLSKEVKKEKPLHLRFEAPYRCIINLQGFQPSWVPYETRHWSPRQAQTIRTYRYNSVYPIESELRNNPPSNCFVF